MLIKIKSGNFGIVYFTDVLRIWGTAMQYAGLTSAGTRVSNYIFYFICLAKQHFIMTKGYQFSFKVYFRHRYVTRILMDRQTNRQADGIDRQKDGLTDRCMAALSLSHTHTEVQFHKHYNSSAYRKLFFPNILLLI